MSFVGLLKRIVVLLGSGLVSSTIALAAPDFDQTPDTPEDFAYKVNWFAVRTSDPVAVANALSLGEGWRANWASGIAAAYGNSPGGDKRAWIFVSPAVKGWVFVVGYRLPYPVMHTEDRHRGIGGKFDLLLGKLSSRFSEVQFFGSYRVVDFVAWAKMIQGKEARIFAYADGQVLANVGSQTREEARLRFVNLSGLSPGDASARIFSVNQLPSEEDVTKIAAAWSIDPSRLSEVGESPGVGMLYELPKAWSQ